MENERKSNWMIVVFFSFISIFMIIPLLYVVAVSLTSDSDIARYGYQLIPQRITFRAYSYIFQTPKPLLNSYMITIIVTVLGTIISLLLTSSIAYVMTRKDYRYSTITTFFVFF